MKVETVNFCNLETANHIAYVIFVLHSSMKTHLLTNQNALMLSKLFYEYMHRPKKLGCSFDDKRSNIGILMDSLSGACASCTLREQVAQLICLQYLITTTSEIYFCFTPNDQTAIIVPFS